MKLSKNVFIIKFSVAKLLSDQFIKAKKISDVKVRKDHKLTQRPNDHSA